MKLFFEDETTVKLRNIYHSTLHRSHVICPPRPAHALVYYFSGRNVFHYGDLHLTCDKNTLLYLPQGVPYTIDRMDETEIIVIDFLTSGQFLSDPFCKKASASGPLPDHFRKLLALWRRLRSRSLGAWQLLPLFALGLTLAHMGVEVSNRYHYSLIPIFIVFAAQGFLGEERSTT